MVWLKEGGVGVAVPPVAVSEGITVAEPLKPPFGVSTTTQVTDPLFTTGVIELMVKRIDHRIVLGRGRWRRRCHPDALSVTDPPMVEGFELLPTTVKLTPRDSMASPSANCRRIPCWHNPRTQPGCGLTVPPQPGVKLTPDAVAGAETVTVFVLPVA